MEKKGVGFYKRDRTNQKQRYWKRKYWKKFKIIWRKNKTFGGRKNLAQVRRRIFNQRTWIIWLARRIVEVKVGRVLRKRC